MPLKRLVFLKDRLAKYEYSGRRVLYGARRMGCGQNWVKQRRNYPDTQATRDALPLMENAYRQMQLNAQADKVAKIIAANSKTPS